MLFNATPMPTLPTTDLDRSRAFYEGVMGFTPADLEIPGGISYRCGDGMFGVFTTPYAGTNKATAMAFLLPTEEFTAAVAALREAGVVFVTFEAEGLGWEDDVAVMEDVRSAWFRDPDGNILNISEAPE